jgi:hypothetical protein
MMLIHYDENAWEERDADERRRIFGEFMDFIQEMESRGKYLGGNPLQPSSAASTLKVRDGKRLVTDGPFAETREQIGGYFLIDASDADEAMEIAAQIPSAKYGIVEIRPIMDLDDHFGGSPTGSS